MSDVIDLSEHRADRDIDPEFRLKDDYGRNMGVFLIDYTMDDGWTYLLRIVAYDLVDATTRLDAIKSTGRIIGQLGGELPA